MHGRGTAEVALDWARAQVGKPYVWPDAESELREQLQAALGRERELRWMVAHPWRARMRRHRSRK